MIFIEWEPFSCKFEGHKTQKDVSLISEHFKKLLVVHCLLVRFLSIESHQDVDCLPLFFNQSFL